MPRLSILPICAALLAAGAFGADSGSDAAGCGIAILRNGFRVEYARAEAEGAATRLWLCGDAGADYVEIPGAQIESFERGQATLPELRPAQTGAPAAANEAVSVANPIAAMIAAAASRHQIDPDFVASVAKAESGLNPAAVSPRGAQGLMQLMPGTAVQLGVGNSFDPAANVEGGTKYLRQLLDQYGGDAQKALAAYNAGPQRVEEYGGVPPYRETRAYVARVIGDYNRKKLVQQAGSNARK